VLRTGVGVVCSLVRWRSSGGAHQSSVVGSTLGGTWQRPEPPRAGEVAITRRRYGDVLPRLRQRAWQQRVPYPFSPPCEADNLLRPAHVSQYMNHAFPHDELEPLTKGWADSLEELGDAARDLDSKYSGVALTLIDSLDTLGILGNRTEFSRVGDA
jgi:hypothetical protein